MDWTIHSYTLILYYNYDINLKVDSSTLDESTLDEANKQASRDWSGQEIGGAFNKCVVRK